MQDGSVVGRTTADGHTDQSWIPRIHTVKGENKLHRVYSDVYMCNMAHTTLPHTDGWNAVCSNFPLEIQGSVSELLPHSQGLIPDSTQTRRRTALGK